MTEHGEKTYEAALREIERANSPQTIAAAKLVRGGLELATQVSACWRAVTDKIDGRASARRPRLKSFEVHHVRVLARAVFLEVIANDGSPTEAQTAAETKIWF